MCKCVSLLNMFKIYLTKDILKWTDWPLFRNIFQKIGAGYSWHIICILQLLTDPRRRKMILKLDASTTVSFCDSISHLSNDTNMYVVRIPLSGWWSCPKSDHFWPLCLQYKQCDKVKFTKECCFEFIYKYFFEKLKNEFYTLLFSEIISTEFLKIAFTGNNKHVSKRSNWNPSKVFVCYVFGSWYVILLLPGIITKITSNHRQNTIV